MTPFNSPNSYAQYSIMKNQGLKETELAVKYIADIYKVLTFVLWTPFGSLCMDIFTGKIELGKADMITPGIFAVFCAVLGLLTMTSGHYVLAKYQAKDNL